MDGLLVDMGLVSYGYADELQHHLAERVHQGEIPDTILLLQHPAVVTIGNQGKTEHLRFTETQLKEKDIALYQSDRGGDVTYHAPGQLVIYPIINLARHGKDLHQYVRNLEEVGIRTAASFGIIAERNESFPGIWVGKKKLASVGMTSRHWVTRHGMAINVNNPLADFSVINPCGFDAGVMASVSSLTHQNISVQEVIPVLSGHLADVFGLDLQLSGIPAANLKHPPWLHIKIPKGHVFENTRKLLEDLNLNTVCEEADCPNSGDCYGRGIATFLIMGSNCTRQCRFCGVQKDKPFPLDPDEPQRVAEATLRLGLKHVVVTSVTRDDLPDGGSQHFAATIEAMRKLTPETIIEVLIPDFGGDIQCLDTVLAANPNILGHNLETVPRIYAEIRPGSDYHRSLSLLAYAAESRPDLTVKSGIMVGVGERVDEVELLLKDLFETGCSSFTLGQYLNPLPDSAPIQQYITLPMYNNYHHMAKSVGFKTVMVGPLVRSSYTAPN